MVEGAGAAGRLSRAGEAAAADPRAPAPYRASAPRRTPIAAIVTRGPHPLATLCMALGAFFAGYQLLKLGPINFTLSDFGFVAAFGICLWRGQITAMPFGSMTAAWLMAVTLVVGGLFVGSLANGDMLRWAIVSVQYATGFLMLPMLLMAQPRTLARRLVMLFILGVAMMEVIGIAVSLTMTHGQAAAMFGGEFISGNGRLSSFAAEPNWNGAVIAFTTPLLIYAYVSRLMPTWLIMIVAPALAWGLTLSASFTGFAATVIALSITLLFVGIRYLASIFLIAAVIGAVFYATGAPLPQVFQDRVGNAVSQGDLEEAGTYRGRVELIQMAWESAEDHLVVGMGADQFRKTNTIKQPVHNIYLLMLNEGGAMSLVGMLMLVGLMIWMAVRQLKEQRLEAAAALAVAIVFIIYSQSSPHIFSRLVIVPIILSLMILYGRKAKPSWKG